MSFNEADTRAKLIDPAIHRRGWTEDLIRREETAGAIEIIGGKARRRARGRVDYILRVKVTPTAQPVAVALLEAKKEDLPPTPGLEPAKCYAASKRLHVRFVFSSNGHQFVEFDALTGLTTDPKPMSEFPTPEQLRARYERGVGFPLADPVALPLLQPYHGGEGTPLDPPTGKLMFRVYDYTDATRLFGEEFNRGGTRTGTGNKDGERLEPPLAAPSARWPASSSAAARRSWKTRTSSRRPKSEPPAAWPRSRRPAIRVSC